MIYLLPSTRGRLDHLLGWKRTLQPKAGDMLVVMGNFGFIMESQASAAEGALAKFMGQQAWTLAFIDGPQENHNRLAALPEAELLGNVAGQYLDNAFHLQRGRVYLSGSHTIFVMGGGHSQDRSIRREGIDWWREELPQPHEVERGHEELAERAGTVNSVLTYTTPSRALAGEPQNKHDLARRLIDELDKIISAPYWYHSQEPYSNVNLETGRNYISVNRPRPLGV